MKMAPKFGEQISRKTPLANTGTDVIIKLKWVLKEKMYSGVDRIQLTEDSGVRPIAGCPKEGKFLD
jgi:hypothetical protein